MEKNKANLIAIIAFGVCALIGALCGIFISGVFNRSVKHIEELSETVVEEVVSDYETDSPVYGNTRFELVLEKVISHTEIDRSDLSGLDAESLRILRNAPYAVAGRYFKDSNLTEFFERYDWYTPSTFDVSVYDLTPTDRENIKLIQSYEN